MYVYIVIALTLSYHFIYTDNSNCNMNNEYIHHCSTVWRTVLRQVVPSHLYLFVGVISPLLAAPHSVGTARAGAITITIIHSSTQHAILLLTQQDI